MIPIRDKFLWLIIVSIIIVTIILGWTYKAVHSTEVRIVRVGLYENPPKIYRDDEHRPAGLFIELIQAIAKKEHWHLVYVDCHWNACLHDLINGDIDLMPDVAQTEEREKRFDFHRIPVTYSWSGIWSRHGLKIVGLPDLNGLRVAILRGAVQQRAMAKMMRGYQLHYTPVLVDSQSAGFEAVLAGKADVVVSNKHFAGMYGIHYGLHQTPIVFNPATLYYAVAKGHNADLLKRIDAHLAQWRLEADSPYYVALQHAMVRPPVPMVPIIWRWILGITVGVVALLVLISILLRWQVRHRTRELLQTNQRFDHLLRASPVVLYQLSITSDGIVPIWVSENMTRLFGYATADVYDASWWQNVVHPEDFTSANDNLMRVMSQQHKAQEYRIYDAYGNVRYIRDEMQFIQSEAGQPAEIVGTWSDLTTTQTQADQLQFLTHFDPLTQLPNRFLLHDRLGEAIQRAKNFSSGLAVLSLDLDRFKKINETFGYATGDNLLCAAAERLKQILRGGDILARLGGDEFVLVLQDNVSAELASETARRILQRFSIPLSGDDQELVMTTSIGISLYPADGEDGETLLKHAEIARYAAKEQGRNRFHFFSSELSDGMRDSLVMENALRGAIERHELILHYQPQLHLNTGRLVGVEALLRWQHPELGFIQPDQFIPLAEESGLIGEIGLWVLAEACQQMMTWDQQDFFVPCVAVNLSAQQIESGQLARQLKQVLSGTGLGAERLELELTESAIMREPEKATHALNEFRALGIKLAVDDFGTGYSSLGYLKRLPLNRLKIDRSFVMDIGRDPGDEAISRAVIQLSRTLGLETVAEGVEREEQADFLRKEGCDIAQGYLYARPLPADELQQQWRRFEQENGNG